MLSRSIVAARLMRTRWATLVQYCLMVFILLQRQRVLLTCLRNAIVHAHPVSVPARLAQSREQRCRTCPSSLSASAPCLIAWAMLSHMPMQFERQRVMLYHVRSAVVHAIRLGRSRVLPTRVRSVVA